MPVTHIPGKTSKNWQGGITRKVSAETREKLSERVEKRAATELATPKEQSIGILRAREIALEAGISAEKLNAAIAAGEIAGAEKQGVAWHISPSALSAWIGSQP
jgi:hypothetical protein